MNKSKIFLTLGVWVAILPYLGFPLFIKNTLFTLTGFALIYLAYILYKEAKATSKKVNRIDTFSENRQFKPGKEETLNTEDDILKEIS